MGRPTSTTITRTSASGSGISSCAMLLRGTRQHERARLHEAFADWMERTLGDRLEQLREVIGYHLEQAAVYRKQVSGEDESVKHLARRGAAHLEAAVADCHPAPSPGLAAAAARPPAVAEPDRGGCPGRARSGPSSGPAAIASQSSLSDAPRAIRPAPSRWPGLRSPPLMAGV
jgi:hypothetical protein